MATQTTNSTLASWLSCGVGVVGILFIVATSIVLGGCLENDERPDGACEVGETRPADDGCNTCSCEPDGTWACTEMACASCEDGETRPDDDGCNTCSCMDGEWACTLMACLECTPGEWRASDDGCHLCSCDEGGSWDCPLTEDCPGFACVPGETMDDGCNSCSCDETGEWLCTTEECSECEPGDTFASEDGCDCFCDEAGFWVCDESCGEPACEEGTILDDGCERCTCEGGDWECATVEDCGGTSCVEGDYRVSDNGCHLCSCGEDGDWLCPDTLDCPGVECLPGEAMASSDGCTDCFCSGEGRWICAEPAPDCGCEPGDTRDAADGCNACFCDDDGVWNCTEMGCPPADTCETDADCFETGCSGQFCAAVDIASTCEWLPAYACYGEPVSPCGCNDGTCGWTDLEAVDACLSDLSMP